MVGKLKKVILEIRKKFTAMKLILTDVTDVKMADNDTVVTFASQTIRVTMRKQNGVICQDRNFRRQIGKRLIILHDSKLRQTVKIGINSHIYVTRVSKTNLKIVQRKNSNSCPYFMQFIRS